MRLQDKVALITGAGSGIGREAAMLFAREGAAVTVVDIDESGGLETVGRLESFLELAGLAATPSSAPGWTSGQARRIEPPGFGVQLLPHAPGRVARGQLRRTHAYILSRDGGHGDVAFEVKPESLRLFAEEYEGGLAGIELDGVGAVTEAVVAVDVVSGAPL